MTRSVLSLVSVLFASRLFASPLYVVTSTTDLADITRSIGGDRVTAESLTDGNMDLHFVLTRPDYVNRLNKADLLVIIGMDLEIGWIPALLNQSRNPRIMQNQVGFVDASRGVKIMERPVGEVNRQMGDIHIFGNPHYWTDPVNGVVIARNIMAGLQRVDPAHASLYQANFEAFQKKALETTKKIQEILAPYKGTYIVEYHAEYIYFINRFGMIIGGRIEERPGVPPGPAHLERLKATMKDQKVRLIIGAPWSNLGFVRKASEISGIPYIILPMQTQNRGEAATYLGMLEYSARRIAQALEANSAGN